MNIALGGVYTSGSIPSTLHDIYTLKMYYEEVKDFETNETISSIEIDTTNDSSDVNKIDNMTQTEQFLNRTLCKFCW